MTELVETPDGVRSRIGYALEGPLKAVRRFTARIGIEYHAVAPLSRPAKGKCVFSVEIRRDNAWQHVFESSPMTAAQFPQDIDIALPVTDRIQLNVTAAGDEPGRPGVLWADAKLE